MNFSNNVYMSNVLHFGFSFLASMVSLFYYLNNQSETCFILFSIFLFYSLLKMCSVFTSLVTEILIINIDSRIQALICIMKNHDNPKLANDLYSGLVSKIISYEEELEEDDEDGI